MSEKPGAYFSVQASGDAHKPCCLLGAILPSVPDREAEILGRLRQIYEAVNSEDYDRGTEFLHPEIELIRAEFSPLKGVEAVRAWIEPDAMEDQRWDPLEFRDNGQKVLVRQRVSARGASSGIELDPETWAVWTFDEAGLVTRVEVFLIQEEDEALKAAGL